MSEFMPLRALVAVIVTTAVMLVPRAWADTAWERYKARFMMPDGRIIDTANGNVSHTEGQGFAMLLAVANNDRPAFDKLWQWTDSTLRDKSNGLFTGAITRWRRTRSPIKTTPPMAIP
jgi:endoglucanase